MQVRMIDRMYEGEEETDGNIHNYRKQYIHL